MLCHVYPQADIPVVQLGIDETPPASFHYEIGKRSTPVIRVARFCEHGCGGVDCAYEQQEN